MFELVCIYDYKTQLSTNQISWIQDVSRETVIQRTPSDLAPNGAKLRQLHGGVVKLPLVDALLVSIGTPVDKELLDFFPDLKYVGVMGSKMSNINAKHCSEALSGPIEVKNVPSYCDFETAEFVAFQMLRMARDESEIPWRGKAITLKHKTLGIIGAGKVGFELAQLAKAFNMNVLYTSPSPKSNFKQIGSEYRPLHELLQNSDVVSIHVPHDTNIFDRETLNQLKRNSLVISTCGGKIFKQDDFLQHVDSNCNVFILDQAGASFLSIKENIKNTVVIPKLAYNTDESQDNLFKEIVNNLKGFFEDGH